MGSLGPSEAEAAMHLDDVMIDEDILRGLMDPTGAACSFPWESCSYRLLDGRGEMYRSSPSAHVDPDPHIKMDRLPLQLGYPPTWTYYKNCTLPRITVRMHGVADMHVPQLPDRSSVLLSAVTLDAATGTAVSCGLDGDVHQPLVHGACSFSSISFKTTSYNLKGKPVHLLVSLLAPEPTAGAGGGTGSVCVSGEVGARAGNAVLASFVSPPLRVDARKRQTKEQSLLTAATGKGGIDHSDSGADATAVTLTPFAPEVLERRLEKVAKVTEGGGKQLRSPIDNSIDGLRAYLSAVNIRPKCKHPLFLVLRFDACVGLFYDTTRTCNPAEDVDAFQRMMQVLNTAASKDGVAPRGGGGVEFLVATKPDHERPGHECGKTDCPVRLSAALSLPKGQDLPPQYRMLCDHQDPPLLFGASEGGCAAADVSCASAGAYHGWTARAASVPRLLGALETLITQPADDQSDGCGTRIACPQAEWEQGLALMAAAMSQHCRTRSAAEIIAFMRDSPADDRRKRTFSLASHV